MKFENKKTLVFYTNILQHLPKNKINIFREKVKNCYEDKMFGDTQYNCFYVTLEDLIKIKI